MKKYKVDVIIPIYNSLNWLKICIYSLFTNTNYSILNKVYLIDDCSNEETHNYLKEVERKAKESVKENNEGISKRDKNNR